MSQDQLGKTTRRTFLSTATVATAASLAAPGASEAQGVGAGNAGPTKLAQADADIPAQLMSRAKAGDWTKPAAMAIPKEGYFQLEQGRYGPVFPKLLPITALRLLLRLNRDGKKRSARMVKKLRTQLPGPPPFSLRSSSIT